MAKVVNWFLDHAGQLMGFALVLAQSYRNGRKVNSLRSEVNGQLEKLLKATSASAHAAGVAEGRELSITEGQARTAEAERITDREKG